MKIYISGPISGCPDGNKELFDQTAKQIRLWGHTAVNPHDLDLFGIEETWADNLIRDIKYLVDCDAVALLASWQTSMGAKLEVAIAAGLGLKFYSVTDHLVDLKVEVTQTLTWEESK